MLVLVEGLEVGRGALCEDLSVMSDYEGKELATLGIDPTHSNTREVLGNSVHLFGH